MRLFIRYLSLACLLSGFLYAQPAPMKFGEVSLETLTSHPFESDKEAKAVILCDYGVVEYNERGLHYDRHIRIKILSETGYQWATANLFYSKGEDILNIAGFTYSLGADGKVVRTKLEGKDIFRTKVTKDQQQLKFTLPALVPGAVIEYRYRRSYDSPPIFLPSWYFQTTEPTVHNEFRTIIPQFLGYTYFKSGLIRPFDTEERKEGLETNGKTNINRWVITNVPALREEPIMPGSLNDQMMRIEFQLSQIASDFIIENFLTTWPAVAKLLNEDPAFGRQIGKHELINTTARDLTRNLIEPEEKLEAIFKYVQSQLIWNEQTQYYPKRNLKEAFQSKNVDSAEQALILVSMLRAVGIESFPILSRTRSEGRPITLYPMILQFNYLITYAKIGQKEYLLDATEKDHPIGMLPVRALNEEGWLFDPADPTWIAIKSRERASQVTLAQVSISEEGVLSGKLDVNEAGYASITERSRLSEAKDEIQYLRKHLFGGDESVEINDIQFDNKDQPDQPLRYKIQFKKPVGTTVTSDRMYVPASMFGGWSENPFTSETRLLPIDFIFPLEEQHIVHFHFPQGYELEERPNSIIFKLSNGSAEFRRMVQSMDTVLTIQSKLTITKPQLPATMYSEIKAMFDKMVTLQADQMVFKKKSNPAPNQEKDPAQPPSAVTPKIGSGNSMPSKPGQKTPTNPKGKKQVPFVP